MKLFSTSILVVLLLGVFILLQPALAETLTLPGDLIEVEDEAFFGDISLTEIILPEGLEYIGSKAFAGTGLTSVVLPSSLKEIADDAFDGPDEVSFTAEKDSYAYRWAESNGYIVPFIWIENSDGTVTITGCTGDQTELDIPSEIKGKTVTGIGEGAFRDNTDLTRVTLPDTITQVGAEAFYGCTNLVRPELLFGLREIGDRAFNGCKGRTLWPPRSLVFIGEDAFTGFRYMNVIAGTYGDQWAKAMLEQDSSLYLNYVLIGYPKASTEVAIEGETVTCTVSLADPYTQSVHWQRSFDNVDWEDCEGEGSDELSYSFIASAENCGCRYRAATMDSSGTYFTPSFIIGYLAGQSRISSAYVSGTNISLGWDYSSTWGDITYTLYMTGPDGTEQVLAEDLYDCFYDVTDLEPETAYTFRVEASYSDWSTESVPVSVTTQNYRSGMVYRALLIGQVQYGRWEKILDSAGDLKLMGNMLQHVTGPQGGAYSMVRKTDLTADQVHEAIRTTFADADDVSLFFIAAHNVDNNSHGEEYAGAVICYNPDTRENEYIKDTTLAEWLSEVPGEVIVILEGCSSGSAIYDSDEDNLSGNGVSPAAMNAAVVSAFQSEDQLLQRDGVRYSFDEEGNAVEMPPMLRIGGLRQSKFHVLTSSAHLEYSYGYAESDFPHTVFTYGLTQAVGLSGSIPCDTNGDGLASLCELAAYIDCFQDPYLSDITQHVQTYPAGSDYALFMRNDTAGE